MADRRGYDAGGRRDGDGFALLDVWVGPAWEGNPEAREQGLDRARNAPPTGTPPQRRFVGFAVPGAPAVLRVLIAGLLSRLRDQRAVAERRRRVEAAEAAGDDGFLVVPPWSEMPTDPELIDLEVELIAAVPVGADLRGVWSAWAARCGCPAYDRPDPDLQDVLDLFRALRGDGLGHLRALRRLLTAAPAWPASATTGSEEGGCDAG